MMRKLAKQTKEVAKGVQDSVRAAFRGVLNLVKSGSDIQQVQVSALADETIQDLELMQHFGFTSVPPAGTQAVVIPLGGKTRTVLLWRLKTDRSESKISTMERWQFTIRVAQPSY